MLQYDKFFRGVCHDGFILLSGLAGYFQNDTYLKWIQSIIIIDFANANLFSN